MRDRRKPVRKARLVIQLKRAYDPASSSDGVRVLVDRLWPRGVTKAKLRIDAWLRDLGTSDALRKWYAHDPRKWQEFKRRYMKELESKKVLLGELVAHARQRKLTLVYGARHPLRNQAVIIKEVLTRHTARRGGRV